MGELWGMGYFEETKILKKSKSQKKKIVAKSCRAKRDCPKQFVDSTLRINYIKELKELNKDLKTKKCKR